MKLESLKNGKYKLNTSQMKQYVGGQKEEKNTEKTVQKDTDPSDKCPCGDYQFIITYDGPWAAYMVGYCTMKECYECPECPHV